MEIIRSKKRSARWAAAALLFVLLASSSTASASGRPLTLQATLTPVAYLPVVFNPPAVSTVHFSTLPPGSALPGDAECARMVKQRPENKGMNAGFNATPGNQPLGSDLFSGDDPRADTQIRPRVSGNFTGTTDEILQWAACKWGIDEDIVRAQAAKESWWQQTAMGDWTSDPSRCAPGHGLGVDGQAGLCPESWGILQDRYPYQLSAWPGIRASTAFNADTAYAIWRACFEGYETWLNNVYRGSTYAAGDAWGCVGRWYAGRWHTPDADAYMAVVQNYLATRIWESPDFQQP